MPTVYVSEPGTRVTKKDERLIVMRGKDQLDDIPIIKVDRVVVMGRGVQVSNAALVFLAQRGIPLVFTSRSNKFLASVSAGLGNNGAVRLAQARIVAEPQRALPVVQAIVAGKLVNQHTVLERYGTTWGGLGGRAKTTIQQMIQRTPLTSDADQARGMEGAGAAAYWAAWVAVFLPTWGFAKRAYYPPPDPLNALLSFGYTLLLNDVLTAVQIVGLDPYLGFFHTVQYGRPSLALDLEEEFRPLVVDRTVLAVLDANAIRADQFTAVADKPGAIYATDAARHTLITAYEACMNSTMRYRPTGTQETVRRVILLQTYHFARVLTGDDAHYQPVAWA